MHYKVNGGFFIKWSGIRDKIEPSVNHYLNAALNPLVAASERSGERVTPAPVLIPGIKR